MIRLEEITIINAPIQRCFDLARSVEVHLVANIHSGEQALAIGGITSGLPELSQRVIWRAKHFGIWQNLTSEYTAMQPPPTSRPPWSRASSAPCRPTTTSAPSPPAPLR